MGTVLPRYLVYGKDVMIVKKMEATAEVGSIQVYSSSLLLSSLELSDTKVYEP